MATHGTSTPGSHPDGDTAGNPEGGTGSSHERRIDRILGPAYLAGLDGASADALRAKRAECAEIETELSYVRRLAQARVEILEAERERRREGRSLADLVERLPELLGGGGARAGAAHTRVPDPFAPAPSIAWNRGREKLIADATLANLPTVSDGELARTVSELQILESEVSSTRSRLHEVMGRIERILAERVAADA